MSLSVAGVWAVGVWDQTVWADGVWREGDFTPTVVADTTTGGGPDEKRKRDLANARLSRQQVTPTTVADEIEKITRSNIDKRDLEAQTLEIIRLEALETIRLDRIRKEDDMLLQYFEKRRQKLLMMMGKLNE
jgi:hypothetical protein